MWFSSEKIWKWILCEFLVTFDLREPEKKITKNGLRNWLLLPSSIYILVFIETNNLVILGYGESGSPFLVWIFFLYFLKKKNLWKFWNWCCVKSHWAEKWFSWSVKNILWMKNYNWKNWSWKLLLTRLRFVNSFWNEKQKKIVNCWKWKFPFKLKILQRNFLWRCFNFPIFFQRFIIKQI